MKPHSPDRKIEPDSRMEDHDILKTSATTYSFVSAQSTAMSLSLRRPAEGVAGLTDVMIVAVRFDRDYLAGDSEEQTGHLYKMLIFTKMTVSSAEGRMYYDLVIRRHRTQRTCCSTTPATQRTARATDSAAAHVANSTCKQARPKSISSLRERPMALTI